MQIHSITNTKRKQQGFNPLLTCFQNESKLNEASDKILTCALPTKSTTFKNSRILWDVIFGTKS